MKNLLMSVLLLSTACSHSSDPAPVVAPTRQFVDLVAVNITGMAPVSPRPNLSVNILSVDGRTLYTGTETKAAATLPARFWIPGSYSGNQPFKVAIVANGKTTATLTVDPEKYAGQHRFNVGEGAVDLTIEVAF